MTAWERDREASKHLATDAYQSGREYMRRAQEAIQAHGIFSAILHDHYLTPLEAAYARQGFEEAAYGHAPYLEVFE